MSSAAIRSAAASMASDGTWSAVAPYYATVNLEPDRDSLPALWSSLAFSASTDEAVTIGASPIRRERGVVTVMLFGQAGTGASTVDAAIESLRALAAGWAWPAGLRLQRVGPPIDVDPGAELGWRRMDLEIEYAYDYVGA